MPRAVRVNSVTPKSDSINDLVFDDIGPNLRCEAKLDTGHRRVVRFGFDDAVDLHSYLSWWIGRERKARTKDTDA